MRRRLPSGFAIALGALAALALGSGCSRLERAEIEVSRRAALPRASEGALLIPISVPTTDGSASNSGAGFKMTLAASGGTSRAELGLVASALDFVGAHARARSVVDGLAHFTNSATQPRVVIRVERTGGRGAETWIIDRKWALRRLAGGAMLVWQGDLAPVLDRLAVVMRSRDH